MTIRPLYPASRPSLDLNFAKTKRLDPRISFSRASSGTYIGSDGLLKSAAINEARFDHSPSTGESLGLLVEEARTNFCSRSLYPGAPELWTYRSNCTIAPSSSVGVDGNGFAWKIFASSGTNNVLYGPQIWTTISMPTTWSCFAKAAEYRYLTLGWKDNSSLYSYVQFDLQTGSVVSTTSGAFSAVGSISPAGNGWYRCSVRFGTSGSVFYHNIVLIPSNSVFTAGQDASLNVVGDGSSGVLIWGPQYESGSFPTSYIPTPATFTSRASSATYYDANGVIQTASTNVARSAAFFPDSNGVMRPAGLLLEAAGTNLLLRSQEFDNAAWSYGSSLTVSANAGAAPDGTTTADLIYANTSGSAVTIFQNLGASSDTFTNTVFAKASGKSWLILYGAQGSAKAWFNVSTGVVGTVDAGITASIASLSNGWYRCSVTQTATQRYFFVAPADSNGSTAVTASGTNGILVWGAQLEASPYPTSYITTSGATVTRSADVSSSATVTRSADVAQITGTNFSSWYRQDEGSVLIRASSKAEQYLLEIPSSNGINYNALAINSARAQFASVNSTTQASIFSPIGTWSLGVLNTASFAYKQDSFAVCSNGSVAATDTSGTVPAVALMDIGRRSNGNNYSCSTISRLTYWPTRLPDSVLQSLTQ